jgi:acetyl-CoA acyltransferase
MRDAVIVDTVRTPVGKRNGALSGVHPAALSALVLTALAERNSIDPAAVDDVVWGCVAQAGEQTMDIARNAVLSAGWPLSVPGTTVDRQCGSSQQSVHFAAAGLIARNGPLALRVTKELMLAQAQGAGRDEIAAATGGVFASADAKEGATAFAEKREPRWTGA